MLLPHTPPSPSTRAQGFVRRSASGKTRPSAVAWVPLHNAGLLSRQRCLVRRLVLSQTAGCSIRLFDYAPGGDVGSVPFMCAADVPGQPPHRLNLHHKEPIQCKHAGDHNNTCYFSAHQVCSYPTPLILVLLRVILRTCRPCPALQVLCRSAYSRWRLWH